jgi:HlyD family secretion protein
VVTYEVVISAPNADLKLKPGLTASVTIFTFERTGVLCVPTKALRFTPTQETIGKQRKLQDCNGKNKVWTLEGNVVKAHAVKIGMADDTHTEIVSGVGKGTAVITDIEVTSDETPMNSGNERSPFAPGPPRRNNKR